MDSVKLFGKNEKELVTLIQIISHNQDLGMEFSIRKYAIQIMRSEQDK